MQSPFRIGVFGKEDDLTQRLRQHFDAARFGHYFRTATLVNTNTGSREWLYAVQDPHTRRCILMKVREKDSELAERIRVKDEMPFIDALDQMGRFEDFSINPQYIAADTAETGALGDTHFNAFANREGLVRDHQSGVFHPTLQGQAVTGGVFDPQDLARTLETTRHPPKETEKFLVPGYATLTRPDSTSIDCLMDMYKTYEKLRRAAILHKTLHNISIYNLSPLGNLFSEATHCKELQAIEPYYFSAARREFKEYNKLQTRKSGEKTNLRQKVGAYLAKPKPDEPVYDDRLSAFIFYKILSELRAVKFDNPALDQTHAVMLDQQELAFEFSLAKSYAAKILIDDENILSLERQSVADQLKARIKIMDKVATRMGIDETMQSALHAALYGETLPTCFEDAETYVKNLKQACAQMRDDIQGYKKNLKNLAP